ncbi:MAG: flagellin [Lachnospiraceae bacterium]|nr:flagellin [Lachnospiraceae bacterium]
MIALSHNLAAMNVQRQLKVNTKKDKKVTERLSSGYRINRAADDAASLTISEKMRAQIRGLNQGTENAQDGVSWVQIGDGALDEVHDMLHRMTELAVQSLNGTYTDADRAAMEAEFSQLQSQIDTITHSTQFNTLDIFSDHEPTYYQMEGNITWPHDEPHDVFSPDNTLAISYREKSDDPPVTVTVTVPEGVYTSRELADEIEDAIATTPLAVKPKLNFEYTENGTFNANLEGGARIESLSGGLSSLLNNIYSGGSTGALIGTTIFTSDSVRLPITAGKNDSMTFVIEDFSGNKTTKSLTIPQGSYTRNQLIDLINDKLSGTNVKATEHGTGIMLTGDDCIISKFQGNMFRIDGPQYTSVFYDNVYHGEVRLTPGTFTGGAVLPTTSYSNGRDVEHGTFEIKSGVNDQLTFKPNGADTPTTITIPEGRYASGDMVSKLNDLFRANGLALTASSYQSGNFSGIKITSKLDGATSDVGLSESSTAFNTLFVDRKYNVYGAQAVITNESKQDRTSTFTGGKPFSSSSYNNLPITIASGSNDTFTLDLDGNKYNITVAAATYTTADAVKTAINTALADADLGPYSGKVTASTNSSGQMILTADMSAHIVNLNATAAAGNNGYADMFTTSYRITERTIGGGNATLDRVFPDPTSISESEKNIRVESSDGRASYILELPTGDRVTHQDIIDKIASTPGASTFTDITFTQTRNPGADRNFNQNISGRESVASHSYSNTGTTVEGGIEGQAGIVFTRNDPATVTVPLKSCFTPGVGTDQLSLTLNGRTETFSFDHIEYTPSTFAAALQQKINSAYGTTFGGATVAVSGNGIKITARLIDENGEERAARDTNISCSTGTSTLLRELNTTRTPASVTTSSNALIPSSGINVSAGDTFEFTLNGVKQTVNLTSLSNGSASSFVSMLNSCMASQGIAATASPVRNGSGYQIMLTSMAVGPDSSIGINSRSCGTVADALFGDLTSAGTTRANTPIQENIDIQIGKTAFRYIVDGVSKTVNLTPGSYTRDTFLTELNSRLEGVTATLNGGYLTLTSDTKGSGSNVSLPYDSAANSSMRAIWGQNESKAPALVASFDSTDHLVLTSEDGTQFRIRSSGSSFVEPTRTPSVQNPGKTSGYYSTVHATMDGGDLDISASNPLVIDEWNDTLKFNYFKGSSRSGVSIDVAHGTYTSYEQLQNELQSKLDGALGSGEVSVSVDQHGVVIKANQAGYNRAFGSTGYTSRVTNPPIFGDFYDKVMNRTTETTKAQPTDKTVGSNVAGTDKIPYVVGRRNVKDKPVTIKSDINDTLSIDFAYTDTGGVPRKKTFEMKLDAGTYQDSSLAHMIQTKLNEQLQNAGLAPNLIEVGIGGTNAVVAGVDNDKVLTFKLSNSLPLPASGEYVIDGIGGNAAFSVFLSDYRRACPRIRRRSERYHERRYRGRRTQYVFIFN